MARQKFLISTQSYQHEYASGVEIPTQHGYLVETDFDDFQRLLKIPTPTESPFGERIKPGLRGLQAWRGKIYVASWNGVHIVDYDTFKIDQVFSHPLMSDLHGIFVDHDGLWLTSCLIDSVLHFSHDQRLIGVLTLSNTSLYPRKLRTVVDLHQDYRLRGKLRAGFASFHANHIAGFDDKKITVTGRGDGEGNGRVLLVDRETLEFKVWIKNLSGPPRRNIFGLKLFCGDRN